MPPRKKARLTPTPSEATPATATPQPDARISPSSTTATPFDPWTAEQETALFKAIIRHKPTGLHKHAHMLSIANYLRSHGHNTKHTRMPAIWEKLAGMYDLDALDERELDHSWGMLASKERERGDEEEEEESAEDEETDENWYREFKLPEQGEDEVFTQMIWDRRLKDRDDEDAASSPPEMPWLLDAGRSSAPSKRGRAAKQGTKRTGTARATRESKQGSVTSEPVEEEDEDEDEGEEVESQADSTAADSLHGRDSRATRSAKQSRGGRSSRRR